MYIPCIASCFKSPSSAVISRRASKAKWRRTALDYAGGILVSLMADKCTIVVDTGIVYVSQGLCENKAQRERESFDWV